MSRKFLSLSDVAYRLEVPQSLVRRVLALSPRDGGVRVPMIGGRFVFDRRAVRDVTRALEGLACRDDDGPDPSDPADSADPGTGTREEE